MARPSQRGRILDAAERVAIAQGAARLTLEAVAAEAGVGKGGLIYHFRSKQDLLKALIGRMADRYEDRIAASPGGRRPLAAHLDALIELHERHRQLAAALLAVAANDPTLLGRVARRQQTVLLRLRRSCAGHADEAVALTLAVDGLYLLEALGMRPLPPAARRRVLAAIRAMGDRLEAPR